MELEKNKGILLVSQIKVSIRQRLTLIWMSRNRRSDAEALLDI